MRFAVVLPAPWAFARARSRRVAPWPSANADQEKTPPKRGFFIGSAQYPRIWEISPVAVEISR